MIKIIRKREGNISIPFNLEKSSIFHRIADITDTDLLFPGDIIVNPRLEDSPAQQSNIENLPETIIIDGKNNLLGTEIRWTLTNLTKNIKVLDGINKRTLPNLEPGLYSVDYKPVDGYITPLISIRNLGERQTLVFDNTYEKGDVGSSSGDDVGTINVFMNIIVGGWRVELLDDNDEVIFSIPEQGYNNLLDFSQTGLPFGKYRIVAKELETELLSPTELESIQFLNSTNSTISWTVTYDDPTQFQSSIDIETSDDRIRWELDAKYREDEPTVGIGTTNNVEVFIAEDNDIWRLKIPDPLKEFNTHIMQVKGGQNPQFQTLIRDTQNDEYRFGYAQDNLKFSLTFPNTISITASDMQTKFLRNFQYVFDGHKFILEHGDISFLADFARSRSPFFSDVAFTVKRYWNPGDTIPAQTINIVSENIGGSPPFYRPNPFRSPSQWNIGYYTVNVNKMSLITIYAVELNSSGFIVGFETVYSEPGTETPPIMLNLANNIIPIIDITE